MPNTSKLSLLTLVFAAACTTTNGPSSGNITHQQATSAYSAASTRMETAFRSLNPHASLTATISLTSQCSVGGDLALNGTYDNVAGFDVTASFSSCVDGDDALDGDLHWTETTGAAGITDTWIGSLVLTDASGTWTCGFDYRSVTTPTSVQLSGTICGFDVASL